MNDDRLCLAYLIFMVSISYSASDRVCPLGVYCNTGGFCEDFTSYDQLGFELCLANFSAYADLLKTPTIGTQIALKFLCSSDQQKLNGMLDMSSLVKICQLKQWMHRRRSVLNLQFNNLAGIDLAIKNKNMDHNNNTDIKVSIENSRMSFYHGNQIISCQNLSTDQTLSNVLTSTLSSLMFGEVKFESALCTESFRNMSVSDLSLINTNRWRLEPKRNTQDNLNIKVDLFLLSEPRDIKFILDNRVLNSDMFAHTQSIMLDSFSLFAIHPVTLFKDLTKLRYLELLLSNMRSFIHHDDNLEWIIYLNYNVKAPEDFWNTSYRLTLDEYDFIQENSFTLKTRRVDEFDFDPKTMDAYFPYYVYFYPDEDFCLFVKFPHKQLVLMRFFNKFKSLHNATCTMAWLVQYVYNNYKPNKLLESYPDWLDFDSFLRNCGLDNRTRLCNISRITNQDYHDTYFDIYDFKQVINIVKEILVTDLGLPISLFGVVSNSLIIVVILFNKIKYKNKQTIVLMNKSRSRQLVLLIDENLYKYMLIHAILSASYCLISLINISIPCASILYNKHLVEHFYEFHQSDCSVRNIAFGYFLSALKLTSNVMILEMSINRYILLGKDHARFMIKLAGLKIKTVVLVSLAFSCLMSIITVFKQLLFAPKLKYTQGHPDQDYSIHYQPIGTLAADELSFFLQAYFSGNSEILIFSIFYDQVAYTLFCLFSLIMDIVTVRRLKKVLAEHANISKANDELKKINSAEIKSFIMVIAFNFCNFLLRLPEILASVILIIGSINPSILFRLCTTYYRCLTIEDLANICYTFSLSINFFLYFIFYSTFRNCSYDFYHCIRSAFA